MARKISVDLDTNKKSTVIAQCKQGDDLLLNVNILEGGLKKDLTNSTIIIKAGKPNGTFVIQNTDITKADNKIIAELVKDFTRVAGIVEIELTLTEGNKQNTTFDFKLIVDESVISQKIEDKSIVPIIEELGNKIEEATNNITDLVEKIDKAEIIKVETETLIKNGGAVTKGELAEVNLQLEHMEQQVIENFNNVLLLNPSESSVLVAFKTGSTKDTFIEFRPCGVNNIMAFNKFFEAENLRNVVHTDIKRSKTLTKTVGTDFISPYVVKCNNPTYDTGATKKDFTGGWHGYNGDQTGAKTAQTNYWKVFVDGVELRKDLGEIIKTGERIDILVNNSIKAYNTKKADGTGWWAIEETVCYTVIGNTVNVEVNIRALENITIETYYGLQTSNSFLWDKSITYPLGSSKTRIDFSTTPDSNSGIKSEYLNVRRFVVKGANDTLVAFMDNSYGLGTRANVASTEPLAFTITYGASGKTYMNLIKSSPVTLTNGAELQWRGGYVFTKNENANGSDLFIKYNEYNKEKILFDTLIPKGVTYLLPPKYLTKTLSVLVNSNSARISPIKANGITIVNDATYGVVELEIT